MFETYCFLLNARWTKFTGADIELKNAFKQQIGERAMSWKGYIQVGDPLMLNGEQTKFHFIKLFKEPPNAYNYNTKKNWSKIYDEKDRLEGSNFELSNCREEDIIIISKFRINLDGQEDIKNAPGGMAFLKEVIWKPCIMFAYV